MVIRGKHSALAWVILKKPLICVLFRLTKFFVVVCNAELGLFAFFSLFLW